MSTSRPPCREPWVWIAGLALSWSCVDRSGEAPAQDQARPEVALEADGPPGPVREPLIPPAGGDDRPKTDTAATPTDHVAPTETVPRELPTDLPPPPGALPKAEPEADAENPASEADAQAPVDALAAATDGALTEKMQRRLRSVLREQHGARTQLARTITRATADGGMVVLALYEYSQFEACASERGGGKQARKDCLDQLGDGLAPNPALRTCTERGLVRARFGPPPPAKPGYGGALTVETTRALTGGCKIDRVRRFELDDVDGDGALELAVDLITSTPELSFRMGSQYDQYTRTLGVYRLDLGPQLDLPLGSWAPDPGDDAGDQTVHRVRIEDTDGDGHVDVLVDALAFFNGGECDFDEEGWLVIVEDEDADNVECSGDVTTTLWRYDTTEDRWREVPSP